MQKPIDFVNFITGTDTHYTYANINYKKISVGEKIFIYIADTNELIYLYIQKEASLFVFNTKYCSYLNEEFWNINSLLHSSEFIIDPNTLINTSNVFK